MFTSLNMMTVIPPTTESKKNANIEILRPNLWLTQLDSATRGISDIVVRIIFKKTFPAIFFVPKDTR